MPENRIPYELLFHSDGSYSVKISLDSVEESIRASAVAKEILSGVAASGPWNEIRAKCILEDGILVLPKQTGVSNEIRLVACAAAAYPDGFPQDAVRKKLGIADTSRDAYINWATKESSKYLRYNAESRRVYTNPDGIIWVYSKLRERKVF